MTHKATSIALAFTVLFIAGCETNVIDRLNGEYSMRQQRLATTAHVAITSGRTEEALAKYKKLYKHNKYNKNTALNYAQLLRRSGDAKLALRVLSPFVASAKKPTNAFDPILKTEYASSLVATGDFEKAAPYIESILENTAQNKFHPDAMNLMGVTLDAQGDHEEAEKMFRHALEYWEGDATPVMNNLALSLAHRGMFDKSLTLLRQARVMSPQNSRITRNIKLVEDLRTSIIPKAPRNLYSN